MANKQVKPLDQGHEARLASLATQKTIHDRGPHLTDVQKLAFFRETIGIFGSTDPSKVLEAIEQVPGKKMSKFEFERRVRKILAKDFDKAKGR